MHPVGTDPWQVMPFHKGIGNTGKSTFLGGVLGNIYPRHLYEVLSNEVEQGFGLEALVNCLAWFAPDIKGNFKLSQCDLQSMISGENVSVRMKHKTAKSMTWTSPGMMGGNKLPQYSDNAGSISRRWLVWEWMRAVRSPNAELEKQIVAEVPNIILKANKAYKVALALHGRKGIWTPGVLPSYFHRTREHVQDATNALSQMLHDPSYLVPGEGLYIGVPALGRLYREFCSTHNMTAERWQADFYLTTLEVHGYVVTKRQRRQYPNGDGGVSQTASWVLGIDAASQQSNAFTEQ